MDNNNTNNQRERRKSDTLKHTTIHAHSQTHARAHIQSRALNTVRKRAKTQKHMEEQTSSHRHKQSQRSRPQKTHHRLELAQSRMIIVEIHLEDRNQNKPTIRSRPNKTNRFTNRSRSLNTYHTRPLASTTQTQSKQAHSQRPKQRNTIRNT
jgi:hypothetical protein